MFVFCTGVLKADGLTSTITSNSLAFSTLVPLVYMSTFLVDKQCRDTRYFYLDLLRSSLDPDSREGLLSSLDTSRCNLRRLIEESKGDSEQLRRYITPQGLTDLVGDCTQVQEYYNRVHESALRLEIEIRDFSALEESRKSIELGNLQIQENKRGL